jgi:hypothetical protein
LGCLQLLRQIVEQKADIRVPAFAVNLPAWVDDPGPSQFIKQNAVAVTIGMKEDRRAAPPACDLARLWLAIHFQAMMGWSGRIAVERHALVNHPASYHFERQISSPRDGDHHDPVATVFAISWEGAHRWLSQIAGNA